ncbi:MAG: hypothetical protein IIC79_06505 [Chloroflexi bacterium]|nr:hypothetical protein [Chloroflexota bacterium]
MAKKQIFIILAIIVLSFSACNFPTASINAVETAAAQTVEAQLAKAGNGDSTLSTPSDIPNIDSPTADPTDPLPTAANTSVPTGVPTQETVCDLAGFVTDVTIPDGTEMSPAENFTKTWRLVNNGTCSWTSGYQLVFFGGDQMGGPSSQQLTNTVINSGQSVDISVDLTAPGAAGTYKGDWKIKNPSGEIFALNGGVPFFVEINVVEATATPTPELVIDFTVGYAGAWFCDTQARRSFKITNTGDLPIQSMRMELQGPVGDYLNAFTNNAPFRSVPPEPSPQCFQSGIDVLLVGNFAYVGGHVSTPPPGGTSGRAIIKLCSEENLGGSCKEVVIDFTW